MSPSLRRSRTAGRFCVPLIAVLALTASGCAVSGSASVQPASMKMTIGYTAIGAAYSDLYICEDKGIFKKNGLDVKITLLNSSSQLVAALVSNSVQIGVGATTATAAGAMNLKGVDLRYIALPINRYYMEMWGKKSLRPGDGLKGHKIGLSSPGSLGDAAIDALVKKNGWSQKDIQKIYLKSTPAEVSALENGAVDAIVTQPPTGTKTREKGFKKIMDFTDLPTAANAYTVKTDYLSANGKAVAAFTKSEAECLALLHNDRDAAVASIMKHSGVDNKALAEYSYDFFDRLWAKNPRVDPRLVHDAFAATVAKGVGTMPKNTDEFVDNSYVDKLNASGFIGSLYR
ncbi:ABC transporter substrate-binding protein [Streptomyces sp. 8L]|uniref:ABC transporter substrate-binding protein n=1 Tax=unclassified Streptomyces TaxID=2593676 RepID=UPI001CD757FD|nr:ABC transporter substrate-binding protein [Streptomyces sp. 8L]MCA1218944.1 ABC transporter substrate-binding protein [Streptomyces sp. 8L]